MTDPLLKATYFGHFCAGTNEQDIAPTVKFLETCGVGSILDYAAEADVEEETAAPSPAPAAAAAPAKEKKIINQCRVYDYKNEEICDGHVKTFEKSITAVRNVSPTGFAAIKITALGNPELLKRASATLTALKQLFFKLDNKTGFVSKADFLKTFATAVEGSSAEKIFETMDTNKDGQIDYIEWSNGINLEDLHLLTSHCSVQGPLFSSVLNEEERKLYARMRERTNHLAALARQMGVRLMIDAEHTYFQPAIDVITAELMRKYNTPDSFPVIFSTYQMYLKDSEERLHTDIERARKGGYKFAAKLVRGAYMVLERDYAEKNGLPDPIHNTLEETHKNYNENMRKVIGKIAEGRDIEVMAATHNQRSVELVLEAMQEHKLGPEAGVYFGQLMGMMDHLTFNLGAKGYKAYKYVPYGKVREVMPYLIRRAQENSSPFGGAALELEMLNSEIKRRLF